MPHAQASPGAAKTYNLKLADELRAAVRDNDVKRVKNLLQRDADPNTLSLDEFAAPMVLWVMARDEDEKLQGAKTKIMAALVEAGANLEIGSAQDLTPLFFAVHSGDITSLNYLLKSGANIEAKNPTGFTALMLAAFEGQSNIVRALTAAAANVNARGKDNVTALIAASTKGKETWLHFEIVKWLVSAGADINLQTADGADAISTADAEGLTDIADYLRGVRAAKIAAANALKTTVTKATVTDPTDLMLLASDLPFDQTKAAALLKAGQDVNAVSIDADTAVAQTALIDACIFKSPEAVRFLLKNGAKVNFADEDGNTVLMYAVGIGKDDDEFNIVQQLLAAGAEVNAKNHEGESALSLARASSNQPVVDVLVKAGAK